jgi:hypothetical protein
MLMQIDKASLRKIDFLPFQVRLSNLFALMDKKYGSSPKKLQVNE